MKNTLTSWGWPLATLCLLLLAAGLTVWRYQMPTVQPPSENAFSGERAMETLRQLLPNDTPHPRGSAEHAAVVGRLVGMLRELGLTPELQETEACSPFGPCAPVRNVMVHFPGKTDDIILVSAHTDSVPTGPGAADDGQGVAIMVELARFLKDKPLQNPVTLLFTDGEEDGLFGAVAYVEGHPSAARVGANINIEARGQTGLSTLFRTAGEDHWLIAAYARNAPSPFTSSVHQVVFELMPHYTDLSVWKSFGIAGVDFAFIDGPEHYHQATDTVDLLDPRSVQSQGDNVLAMLKGLLDADLAHPPRGHANWFDVLGLFVLHWPRSWTLWLASLSCLGLLVGAVRIRKTRQLPFKTLLQGAFAIALTLFGSVLLGIVLSWTLADAHWPLMGLVFLAPLGLAIALGHIARHLSAEALHLSATLLMSLAALPLALFLPGVAHLFVLPPVFAGLGWLASMRWPNHTVPIASLLALSAMTVMWFPLLEGVRIALGPASVAPSAAGMGLVLWWTLPLWRRA